MSESIVYKLIGPTTALSVVNASHNPVAITSPQSEMSNFTAFFNVGASPITVVTVPLSATPVTAVHPTDGGSAQIGFLVPPLTSSPILVATPSGGFQMTAISNSSTASLLYVTPAGNV